MRSPRRPAAHETVPAVNLLSPWVFEAIAARRLQERFAVAAVLLLALMAGGWGAQHLRTENAQRLLAEERTATARLVGQTFELAPVRSYVNGVVQQKAVAQKAMANEVYLSRVMGALERATPRGAAVQSLAVKVSPPAEDGTGGDSASAGAPEPGEASTCPGPDPFHTRTLIGCVTLAGTASSRSLVGRLVVNLGRDPLFVEPFVSTTTTAEGDEVSFTGSVGLSTRTFSHRYDDVDALLAKEAR